MMGSLACSVSCRSARTEWSRLSVVKAATGREFSVIRLLLILSRQACRMRKRGIAMEKSQVPAPVLQTWDGFRGSG
jgi:hypothetical protein